jgi:hypothetical protein
VAVSPDWLDGIAAHLAQPNDLKRGGCQWLLRTFILIPQNVRFALAARTGTTPPQEFQWNETFPAIRPLDGQFGSDQLDVQRSHYFVLNNL